MPPPTRQDLADEAWGFIADADALASDLLAKGDEESLRVLTEVNRSRRLVRRLLAELAKEGVRPRAAA